MDTTTLLWDYYYRVKLPYLQTRTTDELKNLGVNVSGIPAIDNDIPNQEFVTMISINKMVEFYKEGVQIKVMDRKDTKEIYDSISKHIQAWKEYLHTGINIGAAPVEDLIALDQFANTVYEHAKYQFTYEDADSIASRYFGHLEFANASTFFNSKKAGNLNTPANQVSPGVYDDAELYPERDSLTDYFKSHIKNIRRY